MIRPEESRVDNHRRATIDEGTRPGGRDSRPRRARSRVCVPPTPARRAHTRVLMSRDIS